MMWLIHLYDAESVPDYPVLPVEVTPTEITVNDDHCEYRGVIQVNVPKDWPTMEWFVLAMDETEWVAQCETPLFKLVDDQPVPLGPIIFDRGKADCLVENS